MEKQIVKDLLQFINLWFYIFIKLLDYCFRKIIYLIKVCIEENIWRSLDIFCLELYNLMNQV